MSKLRSFISLTVIVAAIFAIIGSGNCDVSRYNLRAIYDQRDYVVADSLVSETGMDWSNSTWVSDNIKYWESASVIITSVGNVLGSTNRNTWLVALAERGWDGVVFFEMDIDYLPTSWADKPFGSFERTYYNLMLGDQANTLMTAQSGEGLLEVDGKYVTNPSTFQSTWKLFLNQALDAQRVKLAAVLPTNHSIRFGFILNSYIYRSWQPAVDDITLIDWIDPYAFGYEYDAYNAANLDSFNAYYDYVVTNFKNKNYYTLSIGNRLDYGDVKSSLLASGTLNGVFFEDVNTSNISTTLTKVTTYRSAFSPADTANSLLLIAGIKNNQYNFTGGAALYGQLLKQVIDAGMYFTPGGEDSYFEYPQEAPGDWWVRANNDTRWRSDPNRPTYAGVAQFPTRIQDVALTPLPEDTTSEDNTPPVIISYNILDYDSSGTAGAIRARLSIQSDDQTSTWEGEYSVGDVNGAYTARTISSTGSVVDEWFDTQEAPFSDMLYVRVRATDDSSNVSGWVTRSIDVIREVPPAVDPVVLAQYGVGGGGQIHAIAYSEDDPDYLLLGLDNGIATLTTTGCDTFVLKHQGLSIYEDIEIEYQTDAVGVRNSVFDGFVMTTMGGVFKIGKADDSWVNMTPMESDFWYTVQKSWGRYKTAIEWSSVASDENNYLVLGAGRVRYGAESTYESLRYPSGSEVVNDNPASADNCPLGYYSVWRYYFDDSAGPKIRPFTAFGDIGTVRDVDVAIVDGDTLVAVSARSGCYYWDSSTGLVTELQNRPVYNGANQYSFVFNGHSDHMIMDIQLTSRGTLYAAVENRDTSNWPSSGIYKIHDITTPTDNWQWLGDGTIVSAMVNTSNQGQSFWNHGAGPGTGNLESQWPFVTVLDGASTDPDTVFTCYRVAVGWPTQTGLVRAFSPYERTYQQETWDAKVWYSYGMRFDGGAPTGGDGWLGDTDFGTVGSQAPGVFPGGYVTYQPNGALYQSTDYGDSWTNIYSEEGGTANYWQSTGYSQSIPMARAAGVLPDDNLLISGFADHGIKIAMNTDWTHFKQLIKTSSSNNEELVPVYPSFNATTQPNMTLGQCWSVASGVIEIVANWNSTGRDAAICVTGQIIGAFQPSRIHVYHDHDNDGTRTFYSEPTLQQTLPQKYLYDALYYDTSTNYLYYGYRKWDSTYVGGGSRESQGIFRQQFSSGTWGTPTTWNDGLEDLTLGTCRGITRVGNNFFTAFSGNTSGSGGIYYRSTSDLSWQKVVGFGEYIDDRDISTLYSDGTQLWAGTRGMSNYGQGTILHCPDPTNYPAVWVRLGNNSINDLVLDDMDSESFTYTENVGISVLTRNQRYTNVISIYKDSNGLLWYGPAGNTNQNAPYLGPYIWRENQGFQLGKPQNSAAKSIDVRSFAEGQVADVTSGDDFMWIGQNPGMAKVSMTNVNGYYPPPESIADFTIASIDTSGGTIVANFTGTASNDSCKVFYSYRWDGEEETAWAAEDSTEYTTSQTAIDINYDTGEAPTNGHLVLKVRIKGPTKVTSNYYFGVYEVVRQSSLNIPSITVPLSIISPDTTTGRVRVTLTAACNQSDANWRAEYSKSSLGPWNAVTIGDIGTTLFEQIGTIYQPFNGDLFCRVQAYNNDGASAWSIDSYTLTREDAPDTTPPVIGAATLQDWDTNGGGGAIRVRLIAYNDDATATWSFSYSTSFFGPYIDSGYSAVGTPIDSYIDTGLAPFNGTIYGIVRATDPSGNVSAGYAVSIDVVVDITPPSLVDLRMVDVDTSSTNLEVIVAAELFDLADTSGTIQFEYSWFADDGNPFVYTLENTYNIHFGYADYVGNDSKLVANISTVLPDSLRFKVTVTDSLGNAANPYYFTEFVERKIESDTTAPTVDAFAASMDNTTAGGDTVTVRGRMTANEDAMHRMALVRLSIPDTIWGAWGDELIDGDLPDTSFWEFVLDKTLVEVTGENYRLLGYAKDAAGNIAEPDTANITLE